MTDLHNLWSDPTIPVILRSTTTSPFGRKVLVAAAVLGLENRITRHDADTQNPKDNLRTQNPLGKMPCLIVGDDTYFDSAVILEMFDALAGKDQLVSASGIERFKALTRARLADGITDAALLMVYEGRFRGHDIPAAPWLDHQRDKIIRALAVFELDPPNPHHADLVAITLGCALGYLDWRQPVEWRQTHPQLLNWLTEFIAYTPAFSQTERTAV